MFACDLCGCVYEWEMFFNNHRRSVHHLKVTKKPRSLLKLEQTDFLKLYFNQKCKRPSLDRIKHLAAFLDLKKETVYWWFFNQNQKLKKSNGNESSNKRRAGVSFTEPCFVPKRKKEGETSNKGGTLDISSDRKKEKRGRVSEENKVGKGTGTI